SHGKPAYCPGFTVSEHGIFLFNKRDQILQEILLKSGKSLYLIGRHDITFCTVVLHRSAVGHDHNHGLELSFRIQIIQYHIRPATIQPFFLISADPVEQVQYRVFFRCGKSGRRVDDGLPIYPYSLRRISYSLNPAFYNTLPNYVKAWRGFFLDLLSVELMCRKEQENEKDIQSLHHSYF